VLLVAGDQAWALMLSRRLDAHGFAVDIVPTRRR
jgi:hypothetical protein